MDIHANAVTMHESLEVVPVIHKINDRESDPETGANLTDAAPQTGNPLGEQFTDGAIQDGILRFQNGGNVDQAEKIEGDEECRGEEEVGDPAKMGDEGDLQLIGGVEDFKREDRGLSAMPTLMEGFSNDSTGLGGLGVVEGGSGCGSEYLAGRGGTLRDEDCRGYDDEDSRGIQQLRFWGNVQQFQSGQCSIRHSDSSGQRDDPILQLLLGRHNALCSTQSKDQIRRHQFHILLLLVLFDIILRPQIRFCH
eukprot:CAMPEP_0171322668 /NCGR_PEP_ID=MMETSP0816-20121228/115104_1 /TAXON_ID=420281 /ORGANISM="Proboscia inermis, Strain CCAP1064/1" /LENGTH=250 /DNA_ID=CAMNT_0011821203 /DNA_START=71 /DNA_END=824 /DNA_ORIENTATION=+